MAGHGWRSDEGWPYDDAETDVPDRLGGPDWDVLALHARSPHLFDQLDPVERHVVRARFGLEDGGPRSMKDLRRETGLDHDQLRTALGAGIAKLRAELADEG
jgi:hypothetical protein